MPDAAQNLSGLWHERDMERIARRLHDRIGPALCAAGLQLSLVEQAAPPPPGSAAAEAIAGLREALDASTREIRTLSYLCDPSLVQRLGLKAAFGYLARAVAIDPASLDGIPSRKDPAASRAFALARGALLHWAESAPEVEFALESRPRSIRILSSLPLAEDLAAFLRHCGASASAGTKSVTLRLAAKGGSPT